MDVSSPTGKWMISFSTENRVPCNVFQTVGSMSGDQLNWSVSMHRSKLGVLQSIEALLLEGLWHTTAKRKFQKLHLTNIFSILERMKEPPTQQGIVKERIAANTSKDDIQAIHFFAVDKALHWLLLLFAIGHRHWMV
jgi:hypothetical protein